MKSALIPIVLITATGWALAGECVPDPAPDWAEMATKVQEWVRNERLVGAELLVSVGGETVLHGAWGWCDREAAVPLVPGTRFNLRSLTKPFTALAVGTLIDEGRLAATDRIEQYLPEFTGTAYGAVTIDHLLTHRGGLPMSVVGNFTNCPDLETLARIAAASPAKCAPGEAFHYCDTGADLLALIVQRVARAPYDEVLRKRVLEPFGLQDTGRFSDGEAVPNGPVASAYLGTTACWERYWSPDAGPMYPYTMGSQSLHGTAQDLARLFSALIRIKRNGGAAPISPFFLGWVSEPVSASPFPHGFRGVRAAYGRLMQVLVPDGADPAAPAFGHGGSDGSVVWAWPDRDLVIVLLTQSRGHTVGRLFECVIDGCISRDGGRTLTAPHPALGRYLDAYGPSGLEEVELLSLGAGFALDLPSQGVVELQSEATPNHWRLTSRPGVRLRHDPGMGSAEGALVWMESGREWVMPRCGTEQAAQIQKEWVHRLASWAAWTGFYQNEDPSSMVEVVLLERGLALRTMRPARTLPLAPPDEAGRWTLRANPAAAVSFRQDAAGNVVSMTVHLPNGQSTTRCRIDREIDRN